jgi:hypothetical protein
MLAGPAKKFKAQSKFLKEAMARSVKYEAEQRKPPPEKPDPVLPPQTHRDSFSR